jgi:hypothetical protein
MTIAMTSHTIQEGFQFIFEAVVIVFGLFVGHSLQPWTLTIVKFDHFDG